jgi:lipopolysaccharide/colanic/teichoic acid biosynthesis glycosyltransferase
MPQLINVLKGEMSLVGPRPEMPFIVAQYGLAECERLEVRPGITGLWQISPARAFPIHENLQYDMHYIRNQNFVLDCAIILHTLAAVIHGVGAV